MQLSYRNPRFWEEFEARHWKPQIPTVLRQPFKEFPFSEDLLLRAMQSVEQGVQGGDRRLDVMVSVADSMKDPSRPLRQLFKQESESLDALEQTSNRVFKKQNFGLIVTNMHASYPGIWNGVAAFLQDARACIDFPVPRAFMDLFYGRYSSKFTGLHKDTQEIFAFVVRGEKRMLAWPFEALLGKVKGLTPGDRYFNKRLDHIDHRKFRKDAVVLDAKAGDVIYWPNDHWHVSEPISTAFSGMMSLGVLRPEVGLSKPSASEFKKRLLRVNPFPSQKELSALVSQDMSEVLPWSDAAQSFSWVTGFGFEIGGPVADMRRGGLQKTVTVVKNKSAVILWHINPSKKILVGSGGHTVTLPYSAEIVVLLEQIARGESVTVASVAKRASKSASISENYWTKQCVRKVRKLAGRDPLAWLVDWLIRVCAVGKVAGTH